MMNGLVRPVSYFLDILEGCVPSELTLTLTR